jgi:hypothetical protein
VITREINRGVKVMSREVDEVQSPVLLSPDEAAAWCHISVGTLNHMRYHGRYAPAIRIGKRCFWTPKDLLAWLESQKEPA